ncbi:MAG: hypothetical protein ACLUFN_05780 [Eubacterium sp.]
MLFCNTLVDRIVTGHIANDADLCSVACEPYRSWIIQADESAKEIIPFKNVTYTDDLLPYRTRKVRILNGAHTMSVLAAYLCGFDIVRDILCDDVFKKYIDKGMNEIKQTISLPEEELNVFANRVLERFNNPFIDHKLLDISLNSVSKFKARCLGSIFDYISINNRLPQILTFSLAALIAFYTHKGSKRKYSVNDNQYVISYFEGIMDKSNAEIIDKTLSNTELWGTDLTKIPDLYNLLLKYYNNISANGMLSAVQEVAYE